MNDQLEIQRVVILGHGGFIGGHLYRFLEQCSPTLEIIGRSRPELDLTNKRHAESLAVLLDERTAVMMCAGVKKQLGDSLEAFSQNLEMTINVCSLLERRPVRKFVFFSSAAVYGEDVAHRRITERTPVHPTSYYGMAKYASERLLWRTLGIHGQRGVRALLVLRPALVYGPGDHSGGYGPSGFLQSLRNGEAITLWGDGEELREFIFVDDVIRVVHDLTFRDCSGVVNLASGRSYTFREVVEVASRLVGNETSISFRPRTKAKVDHKFHNRRLQGFLPSLRFTTLEDGMRRTLSTEAQEDRGSARLAVRSSS